MRRRKKNRTRKVKTIVTKNKNQYRCSLPNVLRLSSVSEMPYFKRVDLLSLQRYVLRNIFYLFTKRKPVGYSGKLSMPAFWSVVVVG